MKIYQVDSKADRLLVFAIIDQMGGNSELYNLDSLSNSGYPMFVVIQNNHIADIRIDTFFNITQIIHNSEQNVALVPFDETKFKEDIGWSERDEQNARRIEELLCVDVREWTRDWSNYDKLDRQTRTPMNVREFSKKLGEKYQLTIKPKPIK